MSQALAQQPLRWEDCVQEALQNNPDLLSARQIVKQAKAKRNISISALLPQIDSELTENTSRLEPQKSVDTYAYGITARQLLFDGLKTPYNIAAASKELEAAQNAYESTSAAIRLRLRTAFIELLRAQHLAKMVEEILARRRQNAQVVLL